SAARNALRAVSVNSFLMAVVLCHISYCAARLRSVFAWPAHTVRCEIYNAANADSVLTADFRPFGCSTNVSRRIIASANVVLHRLGNNSRLCIPKSDQRLET